MSIELEDAKTKVAQFQKQCEEYLVVIVQQKRDADEQQKVRTFFLVFCQFSIHVCDSLCKYRFAQCSQICICKTTRANHPYKIQTKLAKVNSFKYSFFVRIVKDWNSLPNHLFTDEINLNKFKKG